MLLPCDGANRRRKPTNHAAFQPRQLHQFHSALVKEVSHTWKPALCDVTQGADHPGPRIGTYTAANIGLKLLQTCEN